MGAPSGKSIRVNKIIRGESVSTQSRGGTEKERQSKMQLGWAGNTQQVFGQQTGISG